jgi:hypothetical protein
VAIYRKIAVGAFWRGDWSVGVTIVSGIVGLWALCLLSLVFTLPHEFMSATEPAGDGIQEPTEP